MEPLLTTADVAEIMRVNAETVYSLIRNDCLPALKVGGQWRFRQSDICR